MDYQEFIRCVSEVRLVSLNKLLKDPTDEEKVKIHQWVKACNAALLPLIQTSEVVLRNAIHAAVRDEFGEKWYNSPRFNSYHCEEFSSDVVDFKEKISSANYKNRNDPEPNEIIASADFYTWELIFSEDFFNASDNQFLWPNKLDSLFKGIDPTEAKTKKQLHLAKQTIQAIRLVRNRIAHNETPWRYRRVKGAKNLGQARANAFNDMEKSINNCERLIKMISQDKCNAMTEFGWFDNAREVCSMKGFLAMVLNSDK
ncbi:Abi family protein [Vibrio sp. D415a]|uniref:hypothetical protein n=1 Tax=unclassified Vibrio TaxID=2614977 RepID=UPI002556C84F|nr:MULTISPECIES: hypothetical protein [unclassified Vibrio]MDK9731050.1 Abi family protein [Vibrio sp. D415a]MDK9749311.1 Abi family protein [Vibrio sp. D409a]MDK9769658.1 Abi family protein [Vibrio sp. D417a]MDK9789626.1 Abi family protein [Vibrio sp. D421a]